MALNCVMLDGQRNLVLLNHEMTVIDVDSGADIVLRIPSAKTTKTLKASGRVWITDQRLLFVAPTQSSVESLSIPLHSILSTKFEQPTFSGNYVLLELLPTPDGGLTTGTELEIRLKNQAVFQFVALLEKTRERAIYMKREAVQDADDGPPRYDSPVGTSVLLASSTTVPPPSGAPPGYDA